MVCNAKVIINLLLSAVLSVSVIFVSGCGQQSAANTATSVKAMNVLQQDTPMTFEYAGQVKGKDEVKVQSQMSGKIIAKYFKGGDTVQAGQVLYKIDSRQYESEVLSAQGTLDNARATLNNAQTDLTRDQNLYNSEAISEQTVTTQQSDVAAYQATVNADTALLQKAQQNLADTVVYAPISGKLAIDDVAVGTYATAGSTNLVTIGATDSVFVQFNISEADCLKYTNTASLQVGNPVKIVLGNNEEYPVQGSIVAIDRALSDNTGTISVKATLDNPNGILKPGMFTHVWLTGETVHNAILVPQRAVQQLLDKSFVMVVGPDKTSVSKTVTLGDKIGSYYIVKSGLSADDVVVVEGLTDLQEGKQLDVQMVTPDDMKLSLVNTSQSSDADSQ